MSTHQQEMGLDARCWGPRYLIARPAPCGRHTTIFPWTLRTWATVVRDGQRALSLGVGAVTQVL